jgi:hypothetical protein
MTSSGLDTRGLVLRRRNPPTELGTTDVPFGGVAGPGPSDVGILIRGT